MVIVANNQVTPFQLTDQFTMDNFNERINETNTALANKAPGGFGLGEKGKRLTSSDDLNTIFQNGWYYWGDDVPQNAPTEWPTQNPSYCMMRVWCYETGNAIQEISSVNYDLKYTVKRICRNNVWTIEWDNPPLMQGVEYRTTERYWGRPVYVQCINCGNLVNNGYTETDISSFGIDFVVRGYGILSNGFTIPTVNYGGGIGTSNTISIWCRPNTITINNNRTDMDTKKAIVTIYYVKKTD